MSNTTEKLALAENVSQDNAQELDNTGEEDISFRGYGIERLSISHDFSSGFAWLVVASHFNYTAKLEENQVPCEPENP